MSHAAPTFSQIKAQVAAIQQRRPDARTVGIRSRGRWSGDSVLHDGEQTYLIRQCDSPLAMRIALRDGGDDVIKVLVTEMDDRQLSNDILARLTPRKLVPLDGWQIVKSLFRAFTIDPRLTRHPWIAERLMELVPPEGYPPASSGFLDAEMVWPLLLGRVLGLEAERPDLQTLLRWSADTDHIARLQATDETFREAAREWLTGLAGPAAAMVLRCAASQQRPDAAAIGLAAGVVFHPLAAGKLDKAAGRMEERYLCGESPPAAVIEAWHTAATDLVRHALDSDWQLKQQILMRADEILREVGAVDFASLSDTSPSGFDQRLADFGGRLAEALASAAIVSTEPLDEARESVLQHDRSGKERRCIQRVEMAMRLVRWLASSDSNAPPSLAEAARQQLLEGGFIDWARLSLRSGDPVRELSEAYARLFDRVTDLTERRSREFAELLRDWTAAKTTDELIVPVEQILDRVVAPLAAETPVLVIVLDGMSVAVFRELMDDILGKNWRLLAEEGVGLRPGLATVPSVTEVSRTSLLCGRLQQGSATTERKGFAEHPGLLAHCRAKSPPVLFHKASLQEEDDASLAADIRREIGSSHRRVVGVVVNAVDDHLLKGEQIDTRWTRDEIKVLPVLLHEAKVARRTVVLLSDHGHVLDCNARGRKHEGGERWRHDEGEPAEDELRIRGTRVVIPESNKLIAPWTEKVRYGIKKNGYHGGLTPQEMVVPIAVLSVSDDLPKGWSEAPVDLPSWWETPVTAKDLPESRPVELKPRPERKKPSTLFDDQVVEEAAAAAAAAAGEATSADSPQQQPAPPAEWIKALLSSPAFDDQKQIAGRALPSDELFAQLLAAIDSRGGKITSAALARAIQYSPMRLRGLLAVASRVLNVDGYSVLNRDEASDTVELDRDLLCRQFDLVRDQQ